ncbi:MAG: DNA helicase PcrA [Candidatus Caldatribacteriota bacterium]
MNIWQNLNPQQQEAVKTENEPILILAGAGSGKTRVLAHRIAFLILEKKVKPESILAVTFTNKAAQEMKARIESLSSKFYNLERLSFLWMGTFHSICARILRQEITHLGLEPSFIIYDKADQQSIIKQSLNILNLDSKRYNPNLVSSIIDKAKNNLQDAQDFSESSLGYFNQNVARIYQQYQEQLLKNNALDFGDLILFTVKILQEKPAILQYYQEKFQYILVDEYQDINLAQYQLIRLLSQKHQHLFVVGDPDQSIYGFRGADLSNILKFEEDYPRSRVIKLEQNYRSTQIILEGATHLIRHNRKRKDKVLWTSKKGGQKIKCYEASSALDEALFIGQEILKLSKIKYKCFKNFVILYRTNAQSRPFEEIFNQQGIPFKVVGGLRFYERKEIRDLLAYLRFIQDQKDGISFQRLINSCNWGIGKITWLKLKARVEKENIDYLVALKKLLRGNGLSNIRKKKIESLISLLEEFNLQKEKIKGSEILVSLIEKISYFQELQKEGTLKAQTKIENVKELILAIKEFEDKNSDYSLKAYLEYIALITDLDLYDEEEEDRVTLMTLHSAKGLEFPVVFITGFEEGIFPHSRSLHILEELEEERRLCYVGMTRAKDELYLTYAWRRNMGGNTLFNSCSRFLQEIPKDLVEKVNLAMIEPVSSFQKLKPEEVEVAKKVKHADWGIGTIVDKMKTENDIFLTVNFEKVGLKRLSLKYAPLEKI